jgi:enoyl-CoA hydratase
MTTAVLLKEISGNIGTLKLNRPERKNALSPDLLVEIHLTLRKWEQEGGVRVVVITGNLEKTFCSGYDILAIPTDLTLEAAQILKTNNPLELALNTVKGFSYPVIAMINGDCFGAGLNLAMCCDMRIGADHIRAGMPPARLGLVYHPEGLWQFAEVIGMAKTRELFFTAHTYKGPEVKAMGLVDHLVPKEKLSETVYRMAEEISGNAPLSLKGTKTILNMMAKQPEISPDDRTKAQTLILEAFNSDDLKEGQTAFLEKRKPVFKGK